MKILMFLLPVIIAGTVLGLAFSGVIDIPGISPKKKPTKAAAKVEEKPKVEEKKPVVKAKELEKAPQGDSAKGEQAVAAIWNEMNVDKLKDITAKWEDDKLVPILRRMEPDKVVEYLGAIDAERAATLIKLIQKEAETAPG